MIPTQLNIPDVGEMLCHVVELKSMEGWSGGISLREFTRAVPIAAPSDVARCSAKNSAITYNQIVKAKRTGNDAFGLFYLLSWLV
jgi:hypothetical protein